MASTIDEGAAVAHLCQLEMPKAFGSSKHETSECCTKMLISHTGTFNRYELILEVALDLVHAFELI